MDPTPRSDDLRVVRTRGLLQAALRGLVEEVGFDRVTVQEVAARAHVNRATFYRHFANKYDVLREVFASAVEELADRLDPPSREVQRLADDAPPEPWVELFAHVRDNANLYRVMLRDPDAAWVRREMRAMIFERSTSRVEVAGGPLVRPPLPAELTRDLAWGALLGGLEWWLDNHDRVTPEEMGAWTLRFLSRGYFDAMGFPAAGSSRGETATGAS